MELRSLAGQQILSGHTVGRGRSHDLFSMNEHQNEAGICSSQRPAEFGTSMRCPSVAERERLDNLLALGCPAQPEDFQLDFFGRALFAPGDDRQQLLPRNLADVGAVVTPAVQSQQVNADIPGKRRCGHAQRHDAVRNHRALPGRTIRSVARCGILRATLHR